MNDRDRLIELIKYCADCPHPEEDFPCECCRYAKEKNCREAYIADHLIANGVTIQKRGRWDDSGRYKFPSGALAIRCSECGCALHESEYRLYNWHYCPCCGSKMEEEAIT